jgi:hypothetical protein
MATHQLKCLPDFFIAIWIGAKRFEIRRNDRNYSVGDTLVLREYDDYEETYSGREMTFRVTYTTTFEQKDGFIVMGIAQ